MWRAGLAKTETGVAAYEVAQALADFRHRRCNQPGRGAARRLAQSGSETSRQPQDHRMRLLR